jgi:hypothetical protein
LRSLLGSVASEVLVTRANNRHAVDDTMDDVRAKFGKSAVSYLSASRSQSSGVADEFRELAERDV